MVDACQLDVIRIGTILRQALVERPAMRGADLRVAVTMEQENRRNGAAGRGLGKRGYTDVEESVSASVAGDEIPDDPRESGHRMSLLRQWKAKIMSIGKKKSK